MSLQLSDGSVFATRYLVVRRIALGGMGAVYEVEHTETRRRVALKVMLPHIVQSSEMRDRFRREASVAAHIESEHIVSVFDAGIDDATGMPFIVMELLRGEELAQALRRVGRFGPVEVTTFLHQAALALEKTHRSQIVHRDLKPENLFLTLREDGQPRIKVLEFGIAKLVAEGSTQDPGTRSLGTPLYMAPEQFRSGQPISTATDVYALGMIAYTLLVGTSYWAQEAADSANVFMFAGSVMAGPREPASLRARRKGVALPPAFDAWFTRITSLSAGDRFPGALAAVHALAEALGTSQVTMGGAPRPPVAGLSTTGSSSTPYAGAPLAEPLALAAPPDAATQIYLGTGPEAESPQALGPQPLSGSGPQPTPPPGTSSSYNAYGSTAAGPPGAMGAGKVVAAVVLGVLIGGAALVAVLLLRFPRDAAPAPASTGAAPIASVAAATSVVPVAPPILAPSVVSASAPVASVASTPAPSSSAAAPGAARKPPAAPLATSRPPTSPPAEPGKKSIFVRD